METRHKLASSIICCICLLMVLQVILLYVLHRQIDSTPTRLLLFAIIVIALHAALLFFLLWRRRDFCLLSDGRPLQSVNSANWFTFARLGALPAVCYLLIDARGLRTNERDVRTLVILCIFVALVFLSDYIDGKLARRLGQRTRVGQYMDGAGDYGLLLMLCIVLRYFDLISLWFTLLTVIRLLVQCVAVVALVAGRYDILTPRTVFGKTSVFALMTLYTVSLLQLFPATEQTTRLLVRLLEFPAAALVVVSLFYKVRSLLPGSKDYAWQQREPRSRTQQS